MSIHRTKNRTKTIRVKNINIGIIDRMFRFNLGFAILLLSVVTLQVNSAVPVWLNETSTLPMWAYIAILGSIYPLITGIFGYDPVYAIFKKDTLESFLPRDAYMHSETVTVSERRENSKNNNAPLAHNS
ncbi:YgaP family membrane protein [Kaarinaea lacus]